MEDIIWWARDGMEIKVDLGLSGEKRCSGLKERIAQKGNMGD